MEVEFISIMVDPAFDLKPEAEIRGITTTVAADATLRASKDYGALGKSMHPGLKPGHSFILIDKTGIIIWRWDWTADQGTMYLDVRSLDDQVSQALAGGSGE